MVLLYNVMHIHTVPGTKNVLVNSAISPNVEFATMVILCLPGARSNGLKSTVTGSSPVIMIIISVTTIETGYQVLLII